MDLSLENWSLYSEMGDLEDIMQASTDDVEEEEEEFLRDIILQQPSCESEKSELSYHNEMDGSDCGGKRLSQSPSPSKPSTPRTFILSFDKSRIIPATSSTQEEKEAPKKSGKSSDNNKRRLEIAKAKRGEKKMRRSDSQNMDHIMAERKRRLDLSQKFIALSATIPGLKKMDKSSILGEAISYVKELKERVKELEEIDMCASGSKSQILLPDVKARVLENEVLIEIHCEKQNGIDIKIFNMIQDLHLIVTASSVFPFGNSTLGFTIITQMGDDYKLKVNDLVKTLLHQLLTSLK